MKPLRVWGTVLMDSRFGKSQVRAIVAAKSRAAAARAFNVPDSYLRNYGSETGNKVELETALAAPEVAFVAPLNGPERQNFVRK